MTSALDVILEHWGKKFSQEADESQKAISSPAPALLVAGVDRVKPGCAVLALGLKPNLIGCKAAGLALGAASGDCCGDAEAIDMGEKPEALPSGCGDVAGRSTLLFGPTIEKLCLACMRLP